MARSSLKREVEKNIPGQLPLWTPPTIWTPPSLNSLPSWKEAKRVGLDIETEDPHLKTLGIGVRRTGKIVGISFAIEDGPCHYLPIGHIEDNLDTSQVFSYLKDQSEVFTGWIVGANLPYDLDYLWQQGITFPLAKGYLDVQIADPLIDESHTHYSLAAIAERHGVPGKDEGLLKEAAAAYYVDPKKGIAQLPARFVAPYAINDATIPLVIMRRQERILEERNLNGIFALETNLLPALLRMRRRGVAVNQQRLQEVEDWSLAETKKALAAVRELSGRTLSIDDINKAKALEAVLRTIANIRIGVCKNGQPNIDNKLLESLKHPLASAIIRARKVDKIRNTFVASIRRFQVGGRIHATFNQLRAEHGAEGDGESGAAYGRLSCVSPNLQQQPSRDDEYDGSENKEGLIHIGKFWRSIYVPDNDEWVSADYCFLPNTEILTKLGWKDLSQITGEEYLAEYEKGQIYFSKPIAVQHLQYEGSVINIRGRKQVDLSVTANHRCYMEDRHGEPFIAEAVNYHLYPSNKQLQAGNLLGGILVSPNEIRLAVAIQADAADRKTGYRIWLKREDKISRLVGLLDNLGIKYNRTFCAKKPTSPHGFSFRKDSLPIGTRKILNDCKLFSRYLLELDYASRLVFLEELQHWDGSRKGKRCFSYYTIVKHNAEIVQEIAILTGWRGNLVSKLRTNRKEINIVYLTAKPYTWIKTLKKETSYYKGPVDCVTMPHGTVVIRRNGRVAITGQCAQEPRLTVHYAAMTHCRGAEDMARAYNENPDLDLHQKTSEIMGIRRKPAKILALGISYGMGGGKLCKSLGLPTKWIHSKRHQKMIEIAGDEGQALLNRFNTMVPFISELQKKCEESACKKGYITTILGRQLHFPKKKDNSGYEWLHKALNRLIQGSAGDQTKLAVVEADRAGLPLQLQIHDEITMSGNRKMGEALAEIMRSGIKLLVPTKVDVEYGESWGGSM